MKLHLSNAPCSWGIEFADNVNNSPYDQVLGEISKAGYHATELGPVGYLPTEPGVLDEVLEEHELKLIAGTLFMHLHDPEHRQKILDQTLATCRLLKTQGASFLVVIDHVSSPRTDQAGQIDTATRLSDEQWDSMMQTITELATICQAHGITPVLHPHTGSYIEYRDEVDRAMKDLDPDLVKLCVDSGHSQYAGINPAELIQDYGDRVAYLHFKDINADIHQRVVTESIDFYKAIELGVFCPLGDGCVDFAGLRRALEAVDYSGWVTVEQDVDPRATSSALDNAFASRAFIEDRFLQANL